MREVIKLSGFISLIIGTLGLLLNEFILDWGRTTTLTFAVFTIAGLITLAVTQWGMKKDV